MKTKAALIIFSLWLAGCGGDGRHKAIEGADAGAGASQAGGGAPGFAQVLPVFKKNCAACHPSKQPADWLDYSTAKRYADNGLLTRRVVAERSMPERGSPQAAAMTDDERKLIGAWVAAGAPKQGGGGGDAAGAKTTAGGEAAVDSRLVAIQSCVSCHGTPPAGPSDPAVPRLNGQNEEYLRRQLRAYARTDRIHLDGGMNKIAAGLSEDQIKAAARAFAQAATDDAAPAIPVDRSAQYERGGKIAVQNCYQCHVGHDGDGARSNHPLIPTLLGQGERYLRDQLHAYHSGARKQKTMNYYAEQMDDADIDAVSYFFSATPPAAAFRR